MNEWLRILPLWWAVACLAAGCATRSDVGPPAFARWYLETDRSDAVTLTLPESGVRIAVEPKPVLTEYDLVHIELSETELGRGVRFQFTRAAARDLQRLWTAHAGRRLVLTVEGEPLGVWRADSGGGAGELVVFVELADAALPAFVRQLQHTTDAVRSAAKPL